MRAALAFLTILPAGRAPSASSAAWFPLAGCLIGLAVGGAWWGAAAWWSPLVAAVVAVAADLALSGLLHADGLADSADGLLPPLDRARRLDVMQTPGIGAFGAGAVAVALIARVAALASLAPSIGLVVALWCASRTAMALIPAAVPYAREHGLASAFLGGRRWAPAYGVALALGVGVAAEGVAGAAAAGAVLGAAALVALLALRRLGGFTGDVLGAAGMVGETVGLLVAAGRW